MSSGGCGTLSLNPLGFSLFNVFTRSYFTMSLVWVLWEGENMRGGDVHRYSSSMAKNSSSISSR